MYCQSCSLAAGGAPRCGTCQRGMASHEVAHGTGKCNRCFNQEKYDVVCDDCGFGFLNPEWKYARNTMLCSRCYNARNPYKPKCSECHLGLLWHEIPSMNTMNTVSATDDEIGNTMEDEVNDEQTMVAIEDGMVAIEDGMEDEEDENRCSYGS